MGRFVVALPLVIVVVAGCLEVPDKVEVDLKTELRTPDAKDLGAAVDILDIRGSRLAIEKREEQIKTLQARISELEKAAQVARQPNKGRSDANYLTGIWYVDGKRSLPTCLIQNGPKLVLLNQFGGATSGTVLSKNKIQADNNGLWSYDKPMIGELNDDSSIITWAWGMKWHRDPLD